ncbi:LysR substrate-binding domain-containing protein [Ancylobacter moscoviensis]
MAYRLPPLAWLRSFEAAARHSSFSSAAGELNLTPAAVSHQTRCLEHHLGQPLFERMPRGVRLTEIGKAYLPSVRRAFDELSISTAGIFGAGSGATVSIRTSVSFAALRLAPLLPAFRATYPDVHVRLSTAVWADAESMDGIDLEIRFGDGRWPEADAVSSLGAEASILLCSKMFRRGTDGTLRELARRGVIQILGCEDLWADLIKLGGETEAGREVAKVDNSLLGLELAAQGLGCVLVLRSLAEPYLASGRLVEPLPSLLLEHDQAHFVSMPQRKERPRMEASLLRNWLQEHLRTGAQKAGLDPKLS